MEGIGTLILAAGALGTVAFGIVEAFKWTFIGLFGFNRISEVLEEPIYETLRMAYGEKYEELLKAQYKGEQRELVRTIRQGVRVGLRPENASLIAESLQVIEAEKLTEAAGLTQTEVELSADLRNVLGRFELAIDARIDAALTLAQSHYTGKIRVAAAVVAFVIALAVGLAVFVQTADLNSLLRAILVGAVAVPVAPVAKDLVTIIQSISQAIGTRR